ncbi:hypothetical protein DSN45_13080 [Staphylococcus xylosus]|nr:hypothetical protein [Staphylococcus xylosus]MCQ3820566.1 hypothetical protein [Staphylococcus xylosus]
MEYMSKSSCISPTNTMKHNLIKKLQVWINKIKRKLNSGTLQAIKDPIGSFFMCKELNFNRK